MRGRRPRIRCKPKSKIAAASERHGLLARVVFSGALRRLADGASELEVDASNVRELVHKIVQRFPGISLELLSGMSIAIDGDIIQDPLLEPIEPDSEIHFLPAVQGG